MILWSMALVLGIVVEVVLRPGRRGDPTLLGAFTDRLMQPLTVLAVVGPLLVVGFWPPAHGGPAVVSGSGLVVLALVLRALAMRALKSQFQLTPSMLSDDQGIVTDGLYRFVRHPGYTALTAFFIGVALLTGSWMAVLPVIPMVAGVLVRIDVEERLLLQRHPDAYGRYRRTTRWRLVPGVL
jgi:protein-S-isoprenylcysteine O-methyltransferase Ste14